VIVCRPTATASLAAVWLPVGTTGRSRSYINVAHTGTRRLSGARPRNTRYRGVLPPGCLLCCVLCTPSCRAGSAARCWFPPSPGRSAVLSLLARLTEPRLLVAAGRFRCRCVVLSPYAVVPPRPATRRGLFPAGALPPWLSPGRRAWGHRGVLAAVRFGGWHVLVLAVALVGSPTTDRRLPQRRRRSVELPVVPVGLRDWRRVCSFLKNLHHTCWVRLAWPPAESRVWGRHFTTAPWTACPPLSSAKPSSGSATTSRLSVRVGHWSRWG